MTPMFSVREYLGSLDFEVTLLEPATFDAAILGLVPSAEGEMSVCYDTTKVLAMLMADGMTHEGAQEFFEFNIETAHPGPNSPVFLDPLPEFVAH